MDYVEQFLRERGLTWQDNWNTKKSHQSQSASNSRSASGAVSMDIDSRGANSQAQTNGHATRLAGKISPRVAAEIAQLNGKFVAQHKSQTQQPQQSQASSSSSSSSSSARAAQKKASDFSDFSANDEKELLVALNGTKEPDEDKRWSAQADIEMASPDKKPPKFNMASVHQLMRSPAVKESRRDIGKRIALLDWLLKALRNPDNLTECAQKRVTLRVSDC